MEAEENHVREFDVQQSCTSVGLGALAASELDKVNLYQDCRYFFILIHFKGYVT